MESLTVHDLEWLDRASEFVGIRQVAEAKGDWVMSETCAENLHYLITDGPTCTCEVFDQAAPEDEPTVDDFVVDGPDVWWQSPAEWAILGLGLAVGLLLLYIALMWP